MIKKSLLVMFSVTILASCSFNGMFLKPTKIPNGVKKATIKTEKDTFVFSFAGENHQPTIANFNGQPSDLDYTIESVIFKNANGTNLNGWLVKPKSIIPTVTLLHFHGNAGALLNQYQAVSPLLKYGFQIFTFDYSGFGFSEGKATRENVLIDANAALNYLKTRSELANTKLVIYGQSLGGHLASVVAAERQQEIDGLVVEGAFSSYKDIAGKRVPLLGNLIVKKGYSAKKAIKNYKKPLLVIHSKEDKVIPMALGKKIFDNANMPKEFYEIKKKHITGPTYYSEEIAGKIKKMLDLK